MKRIVLMPMMILALFIVFGFSNEKKITIFMIGDSTCANKTLKKEHLERGWGQVLPGFFDSRYVKIDNHAVNGRSSLSFRNEGRWKPIYDKIKKGDYVFIQFGHNDEKPKPDRHTDPGTTFNDQLKRYIKETREKGGIPVLFTPIVRRKFGEDGKLVPTHGDYPKAVRDVAKEMHVVLIDHNISSRIFVNSLGDSISREYYMWVKPGTNPYTPDGKQDDTHLKAKGARAIARIAVKEIQEKIPALSKYVKYYDYVVAKDGSGDFFTVQEAVNAVPAFRKKTTTIYVRNGVYDEKVVIPSNKRNIKLRGEDVDKTIITYGDYASRKNVFGEGVGTSGSASIYIYADGFYAENITFKNYAGPVGQAVACFTAGDRMIFKNCKFLGFQDTLYTWGKKSRQYFKDCYIEGTVDFIFGSSTAVFDACEIHSKSNGYLTAASTPEWKNFGYVFKNCKLTAGKGVDKVYLGRPWRPYAKTVYLNCEMGRHITSKGWHNWGDKKKEKTTYYAEYGSTGPGAVDKKERASWAKQLSSKKAGKYTLAEIFDGWDPSDE